jgi:hypothetical protein
MELKNNKNLARLKYLHLNTNQIVTFRVSDASIVKE